MSLKEYGRAIHGVTELVVLTLLAFFGGRAICQKMGWPYEWVALFSVGGLSLGVFRLYRQFRDL